MVKLAFSGQSLAAAYVKTAQPGAGKKLIDHLSTNVKPYQEMAYSYCAGSYYLPAVSCEAMY